jgi:hypothetical protein
MSLVLCQACNRRWEASRLACCPGCLAARWLATPNLVRDKHDPRVSGEPQQQYRSLVTPRVLEELRAVLECAAQTGCWFHDRDYGMWVHLTPLPLGRAPGVGVPAGRSDAEHALDCLFIAEADSPENAHIFAVDGSRHEAQVRAGVFLPLSACDHAHCENLALPVHSPSAPSGSGVSRASCVEHADVELARWPGASPSEADSRQ